MRPRWRTLLWHWFWAAILYFFYKLEPESRDMQQTAVVIMPCQCQYWFSSYSYRHVVSCILVHRFCIWRSGPPKDHVPSFLKRMKICPDQFNMFLWHASFFFLLLVLMIVLHLDSGVQFSWSHIISFLLRAIRVLVGENSLGVQFNMFFVCTINYTSN